MTQPLQPINTLSELMSPSALALLSASGSDLVRQIGIDVVQGVVLDVLSGRNLRDSTEVLTRRRLAALNLATVHLLLEGAALSKNFVEQLPNLATTILTRKKLSKNERWIAQWALGLTDKAFQNVLRDDPKALETYRDRYIEACQQVISNHARENGELLGNIRLASGVSAQVNWLFLTYLLNIIGAQTLAIRGSEKSAYGKLFEKLILGALLSIFGFEHVTPPPNKFERVFWLASREERRESDATLLYQIGKGARFDIGFIGRGNPEISLDKVTRFEREISLGRSRYYMATIILVDRIGAGSRIEQLAQEVQGTIIQMCASYWPQQVAQILNKTLGFKHPLVNMKHDMIGSFLKSELPKVHLGEFIGLNDKFRKNIIREDTSNYLAE